MDLAAHRGEHRLFLIFVPSPRDEDFVCQDGLLKGSESGFAERDLLRGNFFGDGTGSFDGEILPSGEAVMMRERFGVDIASFAGLLVGKDGTVKHRFEQPVEPGELYRLVDAMPMRRREMREGGRTRRG